MKHGYTLVKAEKRLLISRLLDVLNRMTQRFFIIRLPSNYVKKYILINVDLKSLMKSNFRT